MHDVMRQILQWNFSRGPVSKHIYSVWIQIHKFFINVFALKESVATVLKDFCWLMHLNVSHAIIKALSAQCYGLVLGIGQNFIVVIMGFAVTDLWLTISQLIFFLISTYFLVLISGFYQISSWFFFYFYHSFASFLLTSTKVKMFTLNRIFRLVDYKNSYQSSVMKIKSD